MTNEDNLHPCPKCKGPVDWTNSRDLDVLSSYICCDNCDLIFFQVESMAFDRLPNLDYETTVMKYNSWCETNPKGYREDHWS